jgi:hypothetical protein
MTCRECYEGARPSEGITLCERHVAFDTLLAVAKEAAVHVASSSDPELFDINQALGILDETHPGWREWT